jgi:Leucine-rich repeat (LRR) protein
VIVNCSGLGLNQIPDFCHDSTELDPVSRKIPPRKIIELDLSKNVIDEMSNNSFRCLVNLAYLNLEDNNILLSDENYYEGLFSSLKSLRELNLKHNSQDGFINDKVFAELESLEILRIDSPNNTKFGENFSQLKKLHTLDLSGVKGYCCMRRVRKTTFENLQHLKVLDISSCMVRYIDNGSFSSFQNLRELLVSYNPELGFPGLQNLTFNLKKTKIEKLHLDNIRCFMGPGTMLCRSHLVQLTNTSLKELSLAGNRLEWMERGVLKGLPKTLKKLSLADNRLSSGMYSFEYQMLPNLKELNLSYQLNPPSLVHKLFQNCNENPDLYSCPVMYVPHPFSEDEPLQKKPKPHIIFYISPKLERVHWASSRLYGTLGEFGINTSTLKYLDMQNNIWFKWSGPLHGFETLETVDFSRNFCSKVSTQFFIFFTNVKSLNLSNNFLGGSLSLDQEGLIFRNQLRLEVLDLSNNDIEVLHTRALQSASNIKHLILRGNRLFKWSVSIGHMKNLTRLDLSNNRLARFDSTEMKSLEGLFSKGNHQLTVDLTNNQLSCTCENLEFLTWLTSYKSHFNHFDNYKCLEDSSFLEQSERKLKSKCKSFLLWYIVGCVAGTLVISLTISYLVYKNRWKIRYLRYIANKKIRGYHRLQATSNGEFEYDAYVSYSVKDVSFVKNEMVPNLEEHALSDIKLAIMHRDMEPRGDHATNIMDYISRSKRTICLVSKNYLRSSWQDYELNMARMEGMEARKMLNFVYLILLPDVCQSTYPRKAKYFIKKGFYLEYPEDPSGYAVFWENLRNEIQKDLLTYSHMSSYLDTSR